MVSGRKRDMLEKSQRTVQFAVGSYPDADVEYNDRAALDMRLYPHMFIEDVYLLIMPIGGERLSGALKVFLTTENRDYERMLARALSEQKEQDLAAAYCDFVQECAQTMMLFGKAHYEIVYLRGQEPAKDFAFELSRIRPYTVYKKWGNYYQKIPRELAGKLGIGDKIALPKQDLLIFEIPEEYGDQEERMLKSLGQISDISYPQTEQNVLNESENYVDLTVQMHTRDAALAEITSFIGWGARGLVYKGVNEYYATYRHLRFQLFLAVLREHINKQLNECLSLVQTRVEFDGAIVVEGLPTSRDILHALSELEKGNLSFKDAVNKYSSI